MAWDLRKRIKDSERKKIFGGILDESTLMALYKLSNKGFFDVIYGPLKQGKESSVLLAEKDKKKIAVKIYAIEAGNFKRMHPYLIGDPRFKRVRRDRRSIIYAWCKKEFKNLERSRKAGVSCPEPITFMSNVLLMSFLGKDANPYPRLKDTKIKTKETLDKIVSDVRKMFKKAKLVHGDLSAFNILIGKKPYLIDLSQSVLLSHPNAEYFLKRDIRNICKWFNEDDKRYYEKVIK